MVQEGARTARRCPIVPCPWKPGGAAALLGLGVIGDTLSYGEQTVLLPSPPSGILGSKGVRP